jgi:acyl dehydratase
MGASNRFILEQKRVIAALLRSGIEAATQKPGTGQKPVVPGPILEEKVTPPSPELVAAYVKHVGGDPSAYKKTIPPHLFPQWVFPLQTATLRGLPYPLTKVLNGGFRLEVRRPLPQGEPLLVQGNLADVDDDGRRAILHGHFVTGTASAPEAIVADMQVIVPLSGGPKGEKKKKEHARVPEQAKELARWKLPANAGREFAKLTGDINPIHWIPPAARASGFKNVILHGFSTSARAYEGVVRSIFSGDAAAVTAFECRFTKPLVLPAKVGLYVHGQDVFVGDAPGGPAYLTGSFETR